MTAPGSAGTAGSQQPVRAGARHAGLYGWRARIGHLYPSSGLVGEQELIKMLPAGVALYTTRMLMRQADYRGLRRLLEEAVTAARLVATADVDLIAFNCTMASLLQGPRCEEQVRRRLEHATQIPAVTTAGAVVAALRALGARRPMLLTAYKEAMNRREIAFLRAYGFNVPVYRGLGYDDPHQQGAIDPRVWVHLLHGMRVAVADSVFISCAGSPAVDIIERMERETGLPVVTSNQALLWRCLRTLGIADAVPGFGRLLRT